MKVLVDARKLAYNPSGIGIYTYNFIKVMLNNKINVILVVDIMQSDEIYSLKKLGVDIKIYGKAVKKNIEVFKYFKYIRNIIESEKPNIFWEPNNIIPINLKNSYGEIVTTIHDIFPITSKEHYSFIFRKYFELCLKRTVRISDSLIYVSENTKNEVEVYFPCAQKKENFVSYNIVDICKNNDYEIKDENYFLFIGNIEKRKGVDLLVKSYEEYIKNGGNKKLYIAGAMRDNSIGDMIKNINKNKEYIKYLGYINNNEKNKLLAECSAFVFPSKAEGFGIPPIEALNYNKPCILSNLNIFKEVLAESVNYFIDYSEEEKAIEELKNALFNYKKGSEEENKKIINKYSSHSLGKVFVEFINNINKKNNK